MSSVVSLVLIAAVAGFLGASLLAKKRAHWLALGGATLLLLEAALTVDPVAGLGGLAVCLAVWMRRA
jgi:hypothetical protein